MSSSYPGMLSQFLQNNKTYADEKFPSLPPPWHMAERRGPAIESGEATLVLTCLDPRCVPEEFFGPDLGAAVFRNAGGRATDDAIRSITALRGLIGLKNVIVVHHTDCGVTHVTPKDIVDTVAKDGPGAKQQAEKIDFKLFSSDGFEESVREDVRVLRNAETLAGVNVYGFKLDTFTGKVEPVEV